jgi:NAD(P)-dependent dehydrogenase (short-subunit alcohol dehydrogenase family)
MKTVLITGANRGIGLEHAARYAAAGATVLAANRGSTPEFEALCAAHPDRIRTLAYDASDFESPARLKTELGDQPIDLLFANAGTGDWNGLGGVKGEVMMEVLRVNTVAPLLLAQALADNVAASERKLIALQSSLMGSIEDNKGGGFYAYRASKAALNMVAKSLAQDLKPRGVSVVALHPGHVQTRMGGASAPVTTAQCVEGQQALFAGFNGGDSGRFFNFDGRPLPW